MRTTVLIISIIVLTRFLSVSAGTWKNTGVTGDPARSCGLSGDRAASPENTSYRLSAVSFTRSGSCVLLQVNLGEASWITSGYQNVMNAMTALYCSLCGDPGIVVHHGTDSDLFLETTARQKLADKTDIVLERQLNISFGPATLSVYE